ncbi:putative cathepsin E [Cantharellus anzutake]|uniref:putative cathepsin E n=1 Tax=Cantharellus anzutake TaxID=1750568 RepID=UPI001903EC8D|nr:putative cathepsin E [Cantharellus anzutake]KAF8335926.1 putative cathepsin E [Cantharellus anzutake]
MMFLPTVFAAFLAAAQAVPLFDTDTNFIKFPVVSTNLAGGYSSTLARSMSSSVPATNENKVYVVTPTIGNQIVQLILDTGSSNLWVNATGKYVTTTTSHATGRSFAIQYGSGRASGYQYIDEVRIGNLKVARQSLGVANFTLGFRGVDGYPSLIFGVGPTSLSSGVVQGGDIVPTVLDNLCASKAISANVLGVYFKPLSRANTNQNNGEISLGGADHSKYKGVLKYAPITRSSHYKEFWGIDINKVSNSGMVIGRNLHAIVDTGTTLTYLPDAVYYKFANANNGSRDSSSGLLAFGTKPKGILSITIGGRDFTLTPDQYLIPRFLYHYFELDGDTRYFAWLAAIGYGADIEFILGQKFLEHYYSVYDATSKRVGLAASA